MIGCERRSISVDIHDGLRECLRSFLWQIVPDTPLDEPVFIFAREFLAIGTIVRIMWRTVGITGVANARPSAKGRGAPSCQIEYHQSSES